MRLLRGCYVNFASYAVLEFDYSELGLTLVSGPTGAGKSTLMDAAFWCLFGQTSKEGSVDEVKAWSSNAPCTGIQEVEVGDDRVTVTRIRGKPTQNDLYWVEGLDIDRKIRGKDVTETQKLLEKRLGVSAELFLTSAYMHQFSRADSFFIAKARERRELFEQIAELNLPVRIASGASEARKAAGVERAGAVSDAARLDGQRSAVESTYQIVKRSLSNWDGDSKQRCIELKKKAETFEAEKEAKLAEIFKKIDTLELEIESAAQSSVKLGEAELSLTKLERVVIEHEKRKKELYEVEHALAVCTREFNKFFDNKNAICPTCLGNTNNEGREKHLAELKEEGSNLEEAVTAHKRSVALTELQVNKIPALQSLIKALRAEEYTGEKAALEIGHLQKEYLTVHEQENTFIAQLKEAQGAINPYQGQLADLEKKITDTAAIACATALKVTNLEERITHLTQVYDLSFQLRGKLLENVVKTIEGATNGYLEKYFDGAIRVSFSLDGDKLEVELQKDGNICSFKQLSGGQRCMLKLAFSVSLMKAASDKAGVHFGTLFFDESLGGLDEELKIKAFSLFQELENDHESVILIDHCESFKNLFANQYVVSNIGTGSTIERLHD